MYGISNDFVVRHSYQNSIGMKHKTSLVRMKDKKGRNRSSEQYLIITAMNCKRTCVHGFIQKCARTHCIVLFDSPNEMSHFMAKAMQYVQYMRAHFFFCCSAQSRINLSFYTFPPFARKNIFIQYSFLSHSNLHENHNIYFQCHLNTSRTKIISQRYNIIFNEIICVVKCFKRLCHFEVHTRPRTFQT